MGLVINIDASVIRGDTELLFAVTHKNEKMLFKIYRHKGNMKVAFDCSQDFKIEREKLYVQKEDEWIIE